MQIDGTQVALRYRGSRDLPAAAVTYLYSRLTNLARTVNGPFQQAFTIEIDDRQADCRLFVDHLNGHKIDIDDRTCSDLDGFLLWRKNILGVNHYYGAFTDGTSEEIKPLDEQTGDERLAGYEIPPQIKASPYNIPPVSSSLYSGQMREVVQCYYLGNDFNPFDYRWVRTHGILENPARDPDAPERGDYFVIEISERGVYAAPVVGGDRCCSSWDLNDYFAGEGEPDEFKKTLNLAWNALDRAPEKRPQVYVLLTQADMMPIFLLGEPFSPLAGWAFSASGKEAQNVIQVEEFNGFDFGTTAINRYDCSRVKIVFTVTDGVPSAVKSVVENKKKCTFHRPTDVLWVPSAIATGLYDGVYIHLNEVNGQDAPIHVWYVGEQECVLRYVKSTAFIPAQFSGSGPNASGNWVFCIHTFTGIRCPGTTPSNLSIPYATGYTSVTSYDSRVSGFVLTGANPRNYASESHGSRTESNGGSIAGGERAEIGDIAPNFAALIPGVDPDCFACLCPCSGTNQQQTNFYYTRYTTYNERRDLNSRVDSHAAILPQFEREGVLLLKHTITRFGAYRYDAGSAEMRTFVEFIVHSCTPSAPGGTCCKYDSYTQVDCADSGPNGSPISYPSVVIPEPNPIGAFQGEAVMRGKKYSDFSLPLNGADPGGAYGQAMFWDKNNHTSITLGLTVIGGGLYYEEEEDALALDRETGFVFDYDPGEFVYDGQPITFVGRL